METQLYIFPSVLISRSRRIGILRNRLTSLVFNYLCSKLVTVVEGDQKPPFSIATSLRALLLSLDCSTLPLIHTLYCWVLNKEVSSTIFKVFGMTRPGIEPWSPGPLANTLPTGPVNQRQKTQISERNRYHTLISTQPCTI